MQEDECLKLHQERCPRVSKSWKDKDMLSKRHWKKYISGADVVFGVSHVVLGAFLLIL